MSLLKLAIVALIIAGVAALFGFGEIAEGAAAIAKVLFFIFLAIFAVLVILSVATYKAVT